MSSVLLKDAGFPSELFGYIPTGTRIWEEELHLDYAAKLKLRGNFLAILGGKVQIINKSTGKSVASYSVKFGVMKSSPKLFAAGDYIVRYTCSMVARSDWPITLYFDGESFSKGDNSDDWGNVKTAGAEGAVAGLGVISSAGSCVDDGWVGYGDDVDYMRFDLESAANLSFDVSASDGAKFTIYSLTGKTDKKGKTTYSLKKLQNTSLKAGKDVETKSLLLDKGTYYISVNSTNAKKGGSADYSVAVGEESVFFVKGDDGSNDWIYDKKLKVVNEEIGSAGMDSGISVADWVGFGDASDNFSFELTSAARLSFDLSSSDAGKFSIVQLIEKIDKKGNVSYQMKTLQNTTLKAGKDVTTKELLLDSGTYHITMTSTNAKKGGNADYSVAVGEESVFFVKGDDGSNDWIYDKKLKTVNEEIGSAGIDSEISVADWVGFGDAADNFSFELTSAARLSFDLSSSDAGKFSIVQLIEKVDKKGNVSYQMKTLQNTTLKAGADVTSKELLLNSGTYYITMTSTNAKKGGNADYSVAVNENSVFYLNGDNSDDRWEDVAQADALAFGEAINGWVGFGDTVDFLHFEVNESGKLSVTLDEDTAAAFKSKAVKFSCVNENGKSVALGALDGLQLLSKKELDSGSYFLGVTCAKPNKDDVSYSITLGITA